MGNFKVLKTISDDQVKEVGRLFLINSVSDTYDYSFEKIRREEYDKMSGCDAEESITIYYNATVREQSYRTAGWKDCRIMIKIIIYDRYNNHTYFTGHRMEEDGKLWNTFWLSNHIEVVLFLQSNNLIHKD